MKKLSIVEVVMGAVLVISMIGFYSLQQNGNNDTQTSTTQNAQNNSEVGQLEDASISGYQMPVSEDKSAIMDTTDKMAFYSQEVFITKEKFLSQQYGNIGDTVIFSMSDTSATNNHVPVSAKITNVNTTKEISDEYMSFVDKTVNRAQKSGCPGWNCFVVNHANMSEAVTKEKVESLSSYVIADVVLTNYSDKDVVITLNSLKMPVIEDNGAMSWNTYSEAVDKNYVSRSGDGSNYVLLGMDKPVDYVGMISSSTDRFGVSNGTYYHEPDANMALLGEGLFYLPKGELKLKLLYVITDKELATGKVCFCGGAGIVGSSNSAIIRYKNDGFRIRINQGESNEVNN